MSVYAKKPTLILDCVILMLYFSQIDINNYYYVFMKKKDNTI